MIALNRRLAEAGCVGIDKSSNDSLANEALMRILKLEEALRFISIWKLPSCTMDGRIVSYGYAHGSNGERDYMKDIAAQAIELS